MAGLIACKVFRRQIDVTELADFALTPSGHSG